MKTIEQKAEVGIIVARFQSPFLHEGHQEILGIVRASHPRVIVFLGNSPLRFTMNNPYDFAIRKAMLEEQYKDIEVLYIDDVGDNELWSKNLDRQIGKILGANLKAVLYGSRDSFINGYKGKYPTIELVPSKFISASEIRKEAGIKAKHTLDFRLGIVHALQNQFPSVKATVDMAIVNFETKELLLARKPGRSTLCFVGGFTDPSKDKSAEDAAIRETLEETGLTTEVKSYIGSTIIDDWRFRNEKDKIMTFFYLMKYTGGTPQADDDIEFVTWKKFGEINEEEVSESHRPLLHMLNDYFSNEILRLP
jgi:bifunctional NMN adenylyltransferase/nudix hydrolase